MWNGAVAFGTMTVPVKLFAAVEAAKTVSFRELHREDGAPVAHRMVDEDGEEVARRDAVKGFEVGEGRWVVLSDEEIKAADQPRRKAIEIEDFVPCDQIDPVLYDRPYHLGVQDGSEEAYALLAAALERAGRAGIGRVVLRSREQLVAVRSSDGVLWMHTLRHADELVPASGLDVPDPAKAPGEREREMAMRLVDSLLTGFEPERYEDIYRERVLALVEAKARGEEPDLPEPQAREESDDLLAALEASLEGAKA